MNLLTRDIRSLAKDSAALVQLWLLPVLVLFTAGLFVPASDLRPSIVTLLTLLTILMVTLPLAARLWHDDMANGVTEQIYIACGTLIGYAAARFATLFILTYIPVTLITLAAQSLWLDQPFTGIGVAATLLLSAAMLGITLLVAALTVSLRQGGLLVALLLIPFLLPVFIAFAATTTAPAALYLLGAAAVLAVPLCCLAASHVLRQQLCV